LQSVRLQRIRETPVRILLLCRALSVGGVERQIVILARTLHRRGMQVAVAAFYAGPLEAELHECGISVIQLQKRGRWDVLPFVLRSVRALRAFRPDVLYGFLSTPNMLSVALKLFIPRARIVWGLRSSHVDLKRYDWLFRLAYRLEGRLSRFADLIICNSRAGLEHAIGRGFPRTRMTVIPNGIDTERFKPDCVGRARVRKEWQVQEQEILIGLVARLDAMKDHPTFLRAAALLLAQRADVRFVCVGGGTPAYTAQLQQLATDLGLNRALIWAGERSDMPDVFSALDLGVSSSSGEGFSNTIAEAMACEVPCVVTDVGDSALIVGSTGEVVSSGSPEALCAGFCRLLARTEAGLRQQARSLIVERFTDEVLGTAIMDALCVMK
jgi:glycosyltransferase involved in cell wall biosynthesis